MHNTLRLRLVQVLREHFTDEELLEILTIVTDPVILTVLGDTDEERDCAPAPALRIAG